MITPEPPAVPSGPPMIAAFRELIHNIHQFGQSGEHWSWRCGVGYSTVDPGWVDGACRYDHVCGSWDELVQQGTAHLEKWHDMVLAQAPESPTDSPPKAGRWGSSDTETTTDTVQAPDAAALAYARSEVDKWLADGDPYCILPTRTEHIPALLARLDELEGTS